MNKKINLVELLKDCPKGMELDCAICDNVTFLCILDGKCYPILIQTPEGSMQLSKYGCMSLNTHAKCVILPKGKTTWEGFVPPCQFKDGDILSNGICICIYDGNENGKHYGCYVGVGHIDNPNYFINHPQKSYFTKEFSRLATKEEKEKLFKTIKDNGYKWNPETKTLEKLIIPRFKVGDRVKKNKDYISGIVTNISDDDSFKVEYQGGGISYVSLAYQDEWELVPDKFDINTLKTFDQVLVRLTNNCVWMPKLFSHYDTDSKGKYYPFVTIDNLGYPQCIPYNGNEHLRRTTNNCDEFYRVWEG